eukprot:4899352-Amphidinium_carterae.2
MFSFKVIHLPSKYHGSHKLDRAPSSQGVTMFFGHIFLRASRCSKYSRFQEVEQNKAPSPYANYVCSSSRCTLGLFSPGQRKKN